MNIHTPTLPVVLITGASGNIGRTLAAALQGRYQVVGLDRREVLDGQFRIFAADI